VSVERRTRLILTCGVISAILAALILNACTSSSASPHTGTTATPSASGSASARPSASPSPAVPANGTAGTYQVGQQEMTFTEPAHNGPTGQPLPARALPTMIQYPLARGSATQPAPGPRPLIVFAPGFMQCVAAYDDLLQTWASAGYVVAAVTFPQTNCQLGDASADENDLVNQPQDMSYVISSLLQLSAQPSGPLSGLVNRQEIAAAGQSDGGDTVAALVGNTCCTEPLVRAAAVLSGAELASMPGQYFAKSTPPILFTQGNADTVNLPSDSIQLYSGDGTGVRYYLNLLGASHLSPYEVRTPAEQVVARVTLAFFNGYVLGQAAGPAAMSQAGNVGGTAALVSGGHVPRDAG
jgi:dienelactone hydrolase